MAIEDVFSIEGRGTVVTGRIEQGAVKVGEKVELIGLKDTTETTCTGVEMFNKTLDEGMAGDNVGILLRGIKKDDVERGQVLAASQVDYAAHQVRGRSLRPEQRRRRPSHAVLQWLSSAVLLPHDRRHRQRPPCWAVPKCACPATTSAVERRTRQADRADRRQPVCYPRRWQDGRFGRGDQDRGLKFRSIELRNGSAGASAPASRSFVGLQKRCRRASRVCLVGMHRNRDAELSRSERDSGHGASRVDEILPEAASPYAAQRIKEEVEIPGSVPAFGESRGPAGRVLSERERLRV